jgi:hypothetical protein
MTDLLDGAPEVALKICQEPGCDAELPTGNPGDHFRRYCGEHAPAPRKTRGKAKRPTRDRTPPSIAINVGPRAKGKDATLDAVEDRARQLCQLAAAVVLMAGQPEDAVDLQKGSDPFAKAVRELAEHEQWLRKLAQGGETSARALAWVQFATALLAMMLPILLRHGALPAGISSMAESMFGAIPAEPVPAEPVPDAAAAA